MSAYSIIICALAGLGAGIATGFAGLSAAVFIVPMLVTFLNVSTYNAIGIALASDVLASAISSITYARHGNIAIKKSLPLLISVITFTIVGSLVGYFFTSSSFGETTMSYWMVVGAIALGLKFLFRPINKTREGNESKNKLALAILCGLFIGFVCGFQGTGGGMMMLFALTVVLGYEFKTAVGTSVFIMAFTALIGCGTHFVINGLPDIAMLLLCMFFTLLGAQCAALIANKIHVVQCNRITGVLLAVSGITMLCTNLSASSLDESIIRVVLIVLIVILCVLLPFVLIYIAVYCRRPRFLRNLIDSHSQKPDFRAARLEARKTLSDTPHTDLYVHSHRGVKLHAYLFPSEQPSDRYVIIVHGYQSEVLECASLHYGYYHRMGYNVICPDNAATGESHGLHCGFIVYESENTLLWAQKLVSDYGQDIQIVLHGFSLGGTSALKCADAPSKNIVAIISDSGSADGALLLKKNLRVLYPAVRTMTAIIGNFSLKDCAATACVRNSLRPILLLHGEDDSLIDPQNTIALHSANTEKSTVTLLPGSGHVEGIYRDTEKYIDSVSSFLEQVTAAQVTATEERKAYGEEQDSSHKEKEELQNKE